MKKCVEVGDEFPLEAKVISAKADFFDRKFRAALAICVIAFGGVAAALTFLVGLLDGSYNELQCLWIAYGPVLGAVVGFYFGKRDAKET